MPEIRENSRLVTQITTVKLRLAISEATNKLVVSLGATDLFDARHRAIR